MPSKEIHRRWGRYYCGDQDAEYGPFKPPRDPADLGWTCIYAVHAAGRTKVGLAKDAGARFRQLQLGNLDLKFYKALRVRAPLARQAEMLVHQRLHLLWLGREWFDTDPRTAIREARPIVIDANRACGMMEWNGLLCRAAA